MGASRRFGIYFRIGSSDIQLHREFSRIPDKLPSFSCNNTKNFLAIPLIISFSNQSTRNHHVILSFNLLLPLHWGQGLDITTTKSAKFSGSVVGTDCFTPNTDFHFLMLMMVFGSGMNSHTSSRFLFTTMKLEVRTERSYIFLSCHSR
ncbi:hypothetical protein MLD38_037985 [Melastoma candidum]|uniref:Uncharacterized protein n=1 Tax=Melastoma candidum TaxID=119954 RepID=A0ACB9KXU2_9MYRT|nr:hypothetical protein MLD38_037985 [Melastoma candidum]